MSSQQNVLQNYPVIAHAAAVSLPFQAKVCVCVCAFCRFMKVPYQGVSNEDRKRQVLLIP